MAVEAKKFFGPLGRILARRDNGFDAELALTIGMAIGTLPRAVGEHRVLIGKDTARSNYMIEAALAAGLTATGMYAFMTGPLPTAAIATLVMRLRCDWGLMITVRSGESHESGIIVFDAKGQRLAVPERDALEKRLGADLSEALVEPKRIGRARRIDDAQSRYVEIAKSVIPTGLRFDGLRVVIDCANGAAYKVAPLALWELGAEVFSLSVSPDGRNINRNCGTAYLKATEDEVRRVRADFGIALNGDGSALSLVDERGKRIDPDKVVAVIGNCDNAEDGIVLALRALAPLARSRQKASVVYG